MEAMRADYEQKLLKLAEEKDLERESLRQTLQQKIDELLRLLEDEKQKMGAEASVVSRNSSSRLRRLLRQSRAKMRRFSI